MTHGCRTLEMKTLVRDKIYLSKRLIQALFILSIHLFLAVYWPCSLKGQFCVTVIIILLFDINKKQNHLASRTDSLDQQLFEFFCSHFTVSLTSFLEMRKTGNQSSNWGILLSESMDNRPSPLRGAAESSESKFGVVWQTPDRPIEMLFVRPTAFPRPRFFSCFINNISDAELPCEVLKRSLRKLGCLQVRLGTVFYLVSFVENWLAQNHRLKTVGSELKRSKIFISHISEVLFFFMSAGKGQSQWWN